MRDFVFTSSSVTPGHPDKLCDRISDAVLDAGLARAPLAGLTLETAIAKGIVFVAATGALDEAIDIPALVRAALRQSGYDEADYDPDRATVMTTLARGSAPLQEALAARIRGGDFAALRARVHATVFGYAKADTAMLMPLPIALAHRLARGLAEARSGELAGLLHPDGQAQVSVLYEGRRPRAIPMVTLSSAHADHAAGRLAEALIELVARPALAEAGFSTLEGTQVLVNPDGAGGLGGPARHAGQTGRKIGIDTYGDFSRQSSAGLSGKDLLRIDRIGVYAARHAARNVVAAGLAEECEVQLSYGIGRADPISVEIDSFGSARLEDRAIGQAVRRSFDFRPAAILQRFGLLESERRFAEGFFARLSAYGHVGRTDLALPWEQDDAVAALTAAL